MPTAEEINAEAEAYVAAVYTGYAVTTDPDYSTEGLNCRKDFKEGVKWALAMTRNILPRPPRPNGPPKS